MERRILLKLAIGIAAGAALTASVCAAPLSPHSIAGDQLSPPAREQLEPRPAVTSADEVNRLQPEQVHWGHHWHHRWHRHHWGWHHRHWHRHWHRHHW